MLLFSLIRRRCAKRVGIALMAVLLSGGAARAQGGLPSPNVAHPEIRHSLWEFDRFLDHHPLLETQLRLNPALAWDAAYPKKHPELGDFLRTNPVIVDELKRHPRYFLYRALVRQASAPLRYADMAQIREVLDVQPEVERALVLSPEAIRDPVFLQMHPLLWDFLARHPVRGFEFLPRSPSPDGNGRYPYLLMPPRRELPGSRPRQH